MNEQIMNEESSEQEQLTIEVVYGTPTHQEIISCTVEPHTTIEQAILASGIVDVFPEIDLSVNNVGIWNRVAKLTDLVNDLDRIEVYRPLLADPKEVRKRRAEKAKEEGRADRVTGGRVDPRRSKANDS